MLAVGRGACGHACVGGRGRARAYGGGGGSRASACGPVAKVVRAGAVDETLLLWRGKQRVVGRLEQREGTGYVTSFHFVSGF